MTILRRILKTADYIVHKSEKLQSKQQQFPSLDPFLHHLLSLRKKLNSVSFSHLSPIEARELYQKETQKIKANFKVKNTADLMIPILDTSLKARAYYPQQKQYSFTMVYFHGGGGIFGDIETHDDICRFICQKLGMVIVSVDYRLAPEYPAPVSHEDALQACQWIDQNQNRFGLENADQARKGICLAGDSAGGNIALYCGLEMARQKIPVKGQLIFYPSTDFTKTYTSEHLYAKDLFLDQVDREWFHRHRMQNVEMSDPRLSIILNDDLHLSPPTVLRTAELDVLRDEAEAYADILRNKNTKINFKRNIGVGHGYVNLIAIHTKSAEYVLDAISVFKVVLKE